MATSSTKNVLYVGGLDESVDENVLRSAFVPFGFVKDVSTPLDFETGKHKGFAFVEYERQEDAKDALDNMNQSELFGKTLRVNYAQPSRTQPTQEKGIGSTSTGRNRTENQQENAMERLERT